ncbi:hypothetical protein GDO78_011384 [Eleutherodactylus coqui]|uniref:Uncharacterized protein n=1 Tax=Eleutherodactylus coqui TaxID=57060 RepID=A0A8J6K6J4_ELECQ|nr:hypothetical protein GDO78_011384 [Eleutherodactylus coqui]
MSTSRGQEERGLHVTHHFTCLVPILGVLSYCSKLLYFCTLCHFRLIHTPIMGHAHHPRRGDGQQEHIQLHTCCSPPLGQLRSRTTLMFSSRIRRYLLWDLEMDVTMTGA